MLKKRIIPTLLYKELGLVKGSKFTSMRRLGPVLPAIKVYNSREVDELIFLDIAASNNNSVVDYDIISEFSKFCFVPLTVGGGIDSVEKVNKLLEIGADKISINSAAYGNPNLVEQIANQFGSQCIVCSVDAKKINNNWTCFSNSGTNNKDICPVRWCKRLEDLGAGEILITSIDKDGTNKGYDLELIQNITSEVKIPVIASGGAGNYDHMYKAIELSGASAVAAASIFHFTEMTPNEAKLYLESKGIPIRKSCTLEDT